jgi:outer membrane protein assembly factor BamE (lipoprotein component of BamABCDE complex)
MIQKVIWLGFVLIIFTGCSAGLKFSTPTAELLVLNKTTYSQVIASLGKPFSTTNTTINEIQVKYIQYYYADKYPNFPPVFKGTIPERTLTCYFLNDTIVYFNYISSFLSDNTYFHPDKPDMLKEGSSKQEVINVLGNPSGEQTFPFPDAWLYHYSQTWDLSKYTEIRKLTLFFNADNTIKKIEYQNTIGK